MQLKKGTDSSSYNNYDEDYSSSYGTYDDDYGQSYQNERRSNSYYPDNEDNWQYKADDDWSNDLNWNDLEPSFCTDSNQKEKKALSVIAFGLFAVVVAIIAISIFTQHSTSNDKPARIEKHIDIAHNDNTQPESEALQPTIDSALLYYRALLNDEEKALYDFLCNEIEKQPDIITDIHVKNYEQLDKVFKYIYADRPDYFWLGRRYYYSYHETESGMEVDLTLYYEVSKQERIQIQARVDAITESIKARLAGLPEYEKVKGVYEYLINSSVYDYSNGGQSLCPVLIDGRGVCASYAKSTQYLLQQMGIQTLFVEGIVNTGEAHAWNIVRIDGNYYQLDTTWGDPINDDGSQTLVYDYFCLTDPEMFLDHFPTGERPIPDCRATDCNYFRREGIFATEYSESWLLEVFRKNIVNGREIMFRTADESLFREYCNMIFEQDGGFRLIEQITGQSGSSISYTYTLNENLHIISIKLKN